VEVVGQQVVAEHQLARHAERGQHDGGHPSGAVLATGAVVEQGQPAGRAQQPQRGPERLSLPWVGDEPAVHLDHERGGPAAAELAPLALVIAARDELVDGTEVAAADRQVSVFDGEGQVVVPAEQDLARCPEVDHGTQPEPVEPFGVGTGQLAERVAAEQPAADHLRPADAAVAADVPDVHRAVEGDLTRQDPPCSHRTRPTAHRLTSPKHHKRNSRMPFHQRECRLFELPRGEPGALASQARRLAR